MSKCVLKKCLKYGSETSLASTEATSTGWLVDAWPMDSLNLLPVADCNSAMSPGEAKAVELLAPAAPGLDCFLTYFFNHHGAHWAPYGPPKARPGTPRSQVGGRRSAGGGRCPSLYSIFVATKVQIKNLINKNSTFHLTDCSH